MAADVAALTRPIGDEAAAVLAQPSPLASFWAAFRENRGAVIGLSISSLMAGAVLTETIFSWPGVGHWLIDSIGRRDYPALQGGVLLISAVVVLVNLLVDLVYGVIDPRISHGR